MSLKMKRILSLAMVALLALSMMTTALAADTERKYSKPISLRGRLVQSTGNRVASKNVTADPEAEVLLDEFGNPILPEEGALEDAGTDITGLIEEGEDEEGTSLTGLVDDADEGEGTDATGLSEEGAPEEEGTSLDGLIDEEQETEDEQTEETLADDEEAEEGGESEEVETGDETEATETDDETEATETEEESEVAEDEVEEPEEPEQTPAPEPTPSPKPEAPAQKPDPTVAPQVEPEATETPAQPEEPAEAEEPAQASELHGVVTLSDPNGTLNLRSEPDGDVIATVPAGTDLIVLSVEGDWALVQMADGTTGYVAARFLNISEVPVAAEEEQATDEEGGDEEADDEAEEPAAERSVEVVANIQGDVQYGDEIELIGYLTGYDGVEFTAQWMVDDGSGWKDIPGENGLTYRIILSEDNIQNFYCLSVTTTE